MNPGPRGYGDPMSLGLQNRGDPFPAAEFLVALPDGAPALLVRWQRDAWAGDRGGYRPEKASKVHVASAGILGAADGEWMTWCGRPVPSSREVAASATAGGDLCRPCLARLVRPYALLPAGPGVPQASPA